MAGMNTSRRKPRPLYIREWREFMGTKVVDLAIALDIERESYYRLEARPHRIRLEDVRVIADEMGVNVNQFWFKPPEAKSDVPVSIDTLLEDVPDDIRDVAIKSVRGIIGK